MKLHLSGKIFQTSFLFAIVLVSTVSISLGSQSSNIQLATEGSIGYWPVVDININSSKTLAFNAFSPGFGLSYGSLGMFQESSELRQIAEDANFKIVRFWDGLTSPYIPSMMPCTYFNEATKTGTYDWTDVDDMVGKILEIGAEPLVCLGRFSSGGSPLVVPTGMATNPTTNLPYPESYASYCAEWVKHFKVKGWNVRFYEVLNEIQVYVGHIPDTTRLGYYMELFDACRTRMKQENPDVIVSFDYIYKAPVLDYWLSHNGPDVDSLNFHKYDDWMFPSQYTDQQMFAAAERLQTWYSIVEAEQVWYEQRGVHLPMLNTECNFNGATPTTDPRVQQMAGAVWLALLLRTEILAGVSYHIYHQLSSGWYADAWGLGMINNGGFEPWYPYYVQHMIGNNLDVGDSIVESTSSSDDVQSLAWTHQGTLNVLLICKVHQFRTVNLQGVTGQLSLQKIDNTIPWTTPNVQTALVDTAQPLNMLNYTVALLQMPSQP